MFVILVSWKVCHTDHQMQRHLEKYAGTANVYDIHLPICMKRTSPSHSILLYPLIQNDYRQEKLFSNYFLQENPVRAPGAITGGALTGQGPIQETIFGELFSGALQENPVIAPGAIT